MSRDEREVLGGRLRRSEATALELLAQVQVRAEFGDTILATVDVGVAVCDADGRLTLLNDTARTWYGLGATEALDTTRWRDASSVTGPIALLAAAFAAATRRSSKAGSRASSCSSPRWDGPQSPVTCSARRMTAADGTMLGAVVAMHDLRSLRARETALADANDRLTQHTNHLERLAVTSRAVLTSDDPRRTVCEAALEIAGAHSAMLWQPDLAHRSFLATASVTAGASDDEVLPPPLVLDDESSLVAACYQQNRTILVADAARHPLASPLIAAVLGEASGVWLPVPDRDGTVGGVLVVLWTTRVSALPAGTSALLASLASEAAHAFDRADLVAQLGQAAVHDALTGLPNRRRWDEVAGVEIARAARTGAPVTFAIIDLDHFKAYNDTRGHLGGDDLLREFARRAPSHLRDLDVLARWGGEEFAIALPGCTAEQARLVADRIRGDVPDGQTCSVGVCEWRPGQDIAQVMAAADAALYRAKRQGRDRTVLADDTRPDGARPEGAPRPLSVSASSADR